MRRGTRVGQAYVAVTADGSGINEEIVDSVDEAGPGVRKAGDEHGKEYGDEFGDSLSERLEPLMEKLGDKLSRRLSRRIGDGIKSSFSDEASNSIGARIGDIIGQRTSDRMEEVINQQMNLLEDRLDSVSGNGGGRGGSGGGSNAGNNGPGNDQRLVKTSIEFATMFEVARQKLHADANNAIEADDKDLLKSQQKLYDSVMRMEQQKTAFIAKFMAAREKLQQQSNDAIYKDDERLYRDQTKLYDRLAADARRRDKESRALHAKSNRDKGKDSDGLGALVGGLLGAGSRNNALNLFGKAVGGLVSGVENLASVSKKMFAGFQEGWAQAEEGASGFQKLLAGGGGAGSAALSSLAATGPAAVAAIGAVIVAMSVLASVASALLAIITALVSTIVSGLVGGLFVLGGAFAATAAAAGLLVVAFTSMTDAQSKLLSDAFRPLKAELTGIGQLMITQMIPYFSIWSENLQKALVLAAPVAAVMGQAFGQAGAALTAAVSGPGFQRFAQALGVWLPSITQSLSVAFGNFLNGVTAIFAALLPLVNRFAGYLADVTARFSAWANSAQGQNSIVDFANRAVASLQSLWNFVREFVGFIADVLFSPEAQNFGNEMFDGLADSFERLREKIDSGDLQHWFDEARAFGNKLWKVLVALSDTFAALNNSGVLEATATGLGLFADTVNIMNGSLRLAVDLLGTDLVNALAVVTDPVNEISRQLNTVASAIENVLGMASRLPGVSIGGGGGDGGGGSWGGSSSSAGTYNPLDHLPGSAGNGLGVLMSNQNPVTPKFNIPDLISSGTSALNATSTDHGGYKKPKEWVNPYKDYAESLIKDGPSVLQSIRQTMRQMTRDVASILNEASKALDADAARSVLGGQAKAMREAGKAGVEKAQQAINSAAQNLASASTPKEAAKALAEVRKAQKDMTVALKAQRKLNAAAAKLAAQRVVTPSNVQALLNGEKVRGATLADFARARERVAAQIERANEKLAAAIQLRDEFKSQVTDSIKAFGALTTAQAKTINGVEQALTAADITSNLQERLDKIKKFQENLRLLLASGLSNEAYQQIVEMGVEGGSAYAQALVTGGQGAINQTNGLVSAIGGIAESLGIETSNRLYQAGVDAAQGLVDGLESLSAQLDSAAAKLGDSIAKAIKKSLGIKSPSRVLRDDMEYVGDGIVEGLDNQHSKVGSAAGRLSGRIAVSPEVAQYAARQGTDPSVSGNAPGQKFRDLIVHTPTEDPQAVAMEVLNEVTGRL